jgi:hypothetical protein
MGRTDIQTTGSPCGEPRSEWLPAFPWFFVVVFVNRHGVEVLCLEDLAAIEAADIVDAVAAVKKFGPLVLTTLHSEVTPILD